MGVFRSARAKLVTLGKFHTQSVLQERNAKSAIPKALSNSVPKVQQRSILPRLQVVTGGTPKCHSKRVTPSVSCVIIQKVISKSVLQ